MERYDIQISQNRRKCTILLIKKLRSGVFFLGLGCIPIIILLKSKYYDPVYIVPKKVIADAILKEKDDEARAVLFYNMFFINNVDMEHPLVL